MTFRDQRRDPFPSITWPARSAPAKRRFWRTRAASTHADRDRGLPRHHLQQLLTINPRGLGADIDAVEQRARDALPVPLDHTDRAGTLVLRVIGAAARARFHGNTENKHRR